MMDPDLLSVLQDAYGDSPYPEEFTTRYTLMECLAERNGIDTFLAQDAGGNQFIAKCFDPSAWSVEGDDILAGLDHPGLPKPGALYRSDRMTVVVREFIEGVSLDRYARDNDLSVREITSICLDLCDILGYLHHRPEPIIHRDIKPQNVIVKPDGRVALIDFDIARVYRSGSDTDTQFFGTRAYAPPEQYGFAQTDARADIYSLGVLLRFLLTGSPRDNKNVRVYKPLEKIIQKCTAFDPTRRYADVDQVRKALLRANPTSQRLRFAGIVAAVVVAAALIAFAGVKIYQKVTYTPFSSDAIPAVLNDEEREADAVAYLQEKYGTHLFDDPDALATVGLLRQALIELYGLDHDYVYASQDEGLPGESEEFFMPWGWDDAQNLRMETAVYAAVKVHDPSLVGEDQWSKLKDDNGEYPGARVAMLFAGETGILTGANRPYDITTGEMAIIFANADRVFEAADASSI